MNAILRKLRGLTGFGVTWGVGWGVIGAGIGLVIGVVNPTAWTWSNPIVDWALGMGMYGFVSGVGFGKMLAFVERRKTLRELSLGRVALWGLFGSAVAPLIFGFLGFFATGTSTVEVVGAMLVTAMLGGLSAPGTVALARRSELAITPRGTGELPSGSERITNGNENV